MTRKFLLSDEEVARAFTFGLLLATLTLRSNSKPEVYRKTPLFLD